MGNIALAELEFNKQPALFVEIADAELKENLIAKLADEPGIVIKSGDAADIADSDILLTDCDDSIDDSNRILFSTDMPYRELAERIREMDIGRMAVAESVRKQSGGAKRICTLSLRGGAGASTLTMALGRILNRNYGEKVLYVNFGALIRKRFAPFAPQGDGCNMGQLIYRLKRGTQFLLADYAAKDEELSCLFSKVPDRHAGEVDAALVESLCAAAKREDYDIVLIDLGDRLSVKSMDVLKGSDSVILLGRDREELALLEKLQIANRIKVLLCEGAGARGGKHLVEDGEGDLILGDGTVWIPEARSLSAMSLYEDYGRGIECLALRIMEKG